ncbi:MAG: orotidine-5'-phosphate decarboxylase [Dehalococcoidia bacterium]|jgi:orotidine-5'-phosphate decarboxylase
MRIAELARQRIIVALDVATQSEAMALVKQLSGHVGLFKVGLELITSEGIGIVRKITDRGAKVFLDGKFHDIPNTVEGASGAATRLGVAMFNVHTMGGVAMMQAAAKAAVEEAIKEGIERPLVLGVTILTSIDRFTMNEQLKVAGAVKTQVVNLAELADMSGLDGVIASPREITAIRKSVNPKMLIVTPGVRPKWAATQDQKRIMTPAEAIDKGASYLVIGRPITKPPIQIGTPINAAKMISEEIASALIKRINNLSKV